MDGGMLVSGPTAPQLCTPIMPPQSLCWGVTRTGATTRGWAGTEFFFFLVHVYVVCVCVHLCVGARVCRCVQVRVHSGLEEPRVDTGLFLHLLLPDVMSQGLSMLVRLTSLLWESPSLSPGGWNYKQVTIPCQLLPTL